MGEIERLGEPVVVKINIPGHRVEVGQWVLLYNEVPMRKISDTEYEVYVNAEAIQVKTWEEEMAERLKNMETAFRELQTSDNFILDKAYLGDTPKFIKKGHGSKRLRPWESPRYFG